MGDIFDIWFIRANLTPLSTVRINSIEKKLGELAVYHKLAGEAWLQTKDIKVARFSALLCGIRKRPHFSEETRKKMRDRFAKVRKCF